MVKKDNIIVAEIMQVLEPISKLLTEPEIEELKEHLIIRKFKKSDVMYSEGDVPMYFHCLIEGKVKVYKDGVGGRSQIIRVIKPVEFFGYRAYFANQNYITAASALENTTVCLIPMNLVNKWTEENTSLAKYIIKILAVELGSSDQRIVTLTQKHIRGRLAEALLFLKDSYGYDEEDGCTISAHLSREDLANLSNMTTSNAIRTLSAFASEGLIEINGRNILILDEEKIKKISKIG